MAATQRVSNDRFGNPQVLTKLKQAKTKSGYTNDILKGYVEIKGDLYKLTATHIKSSNSAYDKGGRMWVAVTKMPKRSASTGGF